MAHYTFDIIKYTLITEEGETYKDFIEMMPSLTVQATNYIAATLKLKKRICQINMCTSSLILTQKNGRSMQLYFN